LENGLRIFYGDESRRVCLKFHVISLDQINTGKVCNLVVPQVKACHKPARQIRNVFWGRELHDSAMGEAIKLRIHQLERHRPSHIALAKLHHRRLRENDLVALLHVRSVPVGVRYREHSKLMPKGFGDSIYSLSGSHLHLHTDLRHHERRDSSP